MGGRAEGLLPGQGHRRQDNILFWGSSKEFVQPGDAVEYYGVDFMESIRQRRLPRYADGGLIGGGASASGSAAGLSPVPALAMASGQPQATTFLMNIQVDVTIDGARGDQELQDAIGAAMETVAEQIDQSLPERFAQVQSDPKARL